MGQIVNTRWKFLLGTGSAVALVIAVVAALVTTGGGDKTTVTALFKDASPLVPGNLVQINGSQVGEISHVGLEQGHAKVTMSVDRSVLPLRDNATATIRPVSLLGERFVDLDRGSDSRPVVSESAPIPVGRTRQSVSVDDLLNSLDNPTSSALAATVTALGEGGQGQGQNFDAALKALAPAMQDTQRLGSVLDQQTGTLERLLQRAAPVAQSVATNNGHDLDRLVGSATGTLNATADERKALDSTIRQLPSTLQTAQKTLADVGAVSSTTTPALRDIRPVTDQLPAVMKEINTFADSANPALASLNPVLDRAKSMLDEAAPLVADLRTAGPALRSGAPPARGIVQDLTPRFTRIMDFIKYWALSTNGRDGVSNYFRGIVPDTPQALLQVPGIGLDPSPPGAKAPGPPAPGSPSGPTPLGPPPGAQPPAGSLGPALGVPAPGTDQGSATGLTRQQEGSMLDQLLGGR